MVKQNKIKEQIDNLSGKEKTLFKKLEAKKHNEEFIPFSLDSKKFTWDNNCKKGCYGRGYVGLTIPTDRYPAMPIPCKCLKRIKEESIPS